MLLCGRYEGFDERVRQILQPDEISIGDYILGGGEVAAMVVIDAVARLVPGVLGDEESHKQDSFSGEGRLLEFAQYTRPREYRGHERAGSADERRSRPDRRLAPAAKRATNQTAAGRFVGPPARTIETTTTRRKRSERLCDHESTNTGLVEKSSLKSEVPEFQIGDTVDVHTRILEGEKERIQIFNGVVIARSGSGTREMFVVRRIVAGEGVERKFPLHSPKIAKIEVKRKGVVRRAKLYFLRDRVGKAIRLRQRRDDESASE